MPVFCQIIDTCLVVQFTTREIWLHLVEEIPIKMIKKPKEMETKYWHYIRLSGKVKSPRKQGPPCSHPRKCFEQVSSDEREHLLMQFNYMGQYDLHCMTPTGIFTSPYRNQFVHENFACDTIHSLFIYPVSANDMPQII